MEQYINKAALVAEIKKLIDKIYAGRPFDSLSSEQQTALWYVKSIMSSVNTLEVKEVDLVIHTIITECCDWLAMSTNLSHDEIEVCRNLMLTVKEEQFKE